MLQENCDVLVSDTMRNNVKIPTQSYDPVLKEHVQHAVCASLKTLKSMYLKSRQEVLNSLKNNKLVLNKLLTGLKF